MYATWYLSQVLSFSLSMAVQCRVHCGVVFIFSSEAKILSTFYYLLFVHIYDQTWQSSSSLNSIVFKALAQASVARSCVSLPTFLWNISEASKIHIIGTFWIKRLAYTLCIAPHRSRRWCCRYHKPLEYI